VAVSGAAFHSMYLHSLVAFVLSVSLQLYIFEKLARLTGTSDKTYRFNRNFLMRSRAFSFSTSLFLEDDQFFLSEALKYTYFV
jgi:hypothetical protein